MDFMPFSRVFYYNDSPKTKEINCTVNKPANISIFVNHTWRPVTEEPREISTATSVFNINLHKLNGGCTYTLKFPKSSSLEAICNIGLYTCKAVTDANETISMTQKVHGEYIPDGK